MLRFLLRHKLHADQSEGKTYTFVCVCGTVIPIVFSYSYGWYRVVNLPGLVRILID